MVKPDSYPLGQEKSRKKKESLESFFLQLSPEQIKNIKAVALK